MEPFTVVSGIAAPLPAANIDTDVIMPKRFLKGVDRAGLDEGAFHDLRFEPGGAANPQFVLNQAPWARAAFLVVGPNFGCGSSREHAVWGLRQLGLRGLIGSSFAGIFFDNCARNGLLAITLEADRVAELLALVSYPAYNRLTVDLAAQTVLTAAGELRFEIDPLLKTMLLQGLDAVGKTLQEQAVILDFESQYLAARPWLQTGAQDPARKSISP